jgi:antitoxin CptB
MRELDRLLSGFLEQHYGELTKRQRAEFEAILEFPDPQLYAYLLGRAAPTDPRLAELIQRIRDHGRC